MAASCLPCAPCRVTLPTTHNALLSSHRSCSPAPGGTGAEHAELWRRFTYLLRQYLPYLPYLEELAIQHARDGLQSGSSVREPLLQVAITIPCPLLQLVEFDRCGAEIQWLLQFMRARASNLHHGQPVLRSVEVYLWTPPSGDVEELVVPFRTAGVQLEVKWNERRQERKYCPRTANGVRIGHGYLGR